MLNLGRVVLAPGVIGQRSSIGRRPSIVASSVASSIASQRRVARIEQVLGRSVTSRQTGPSVRSSCARSNLGSTFLQAAGQRREHLRDHCLAKAAHRAKADRVDRRVAAPIFDQLAHLLAAGVVGDRLGREQVEKQLLPGLEEHGPIVELNLEHVGFVGLVDGQQVVANLAGPRAQVVAAVAQRCQHLAADDAGVGRPDASVGRIDDARILLGRQLTVPACECRRPTSWAAGRRSRRGAGCGPGSSRRCGPCRRRRRSSARASRSGWPGAALRPACGPIPSASRPCSRPGGRARPSAGPAADPGDRGR